MHQDKQLASTTHCNGINGKFYQPDAVKNAFERVLRKIGINGGQGFSCLRDTGATLIEQIDPAAT